VATLGGSGALDRERISRGEGLSQREGQGAEKPSQNVFDREESVNTELMYLVAVTAFTGLMWIPYILDRIAVWGLADTVGYPDNPKQQSPWARRMRSAHGNAVENLVVFAALVLAAHAAGVSTNATVLACAVYFWARVVHFFAYAAAMPWVRTLAFVAGFFAQAVIAWQLLVR
jgi:uncharacterized MAPEG superfamily protein